MKSKATGCGSISTVFSGIVLLCVSVSSIIIIIIIIIIIMILITLLKQSIELKRPKWVLESSFKVHYDNVIMCRRAFAKQ